MTTHLNRHLFTLAFWLGLSAVAWVGAGFIGSHVLALVMTLVIAAVYAFGALELQQFRLATATLTKALSAIPEPLPELNDWLGGIHASLQNPVRLRIEGERVGLPGPALTPYLVGLLVMLGMLGTFLGLVVTLNGAVFALEGSTDLQGIRSALAAPIKGLGLAFGTSVAGVAASAMLGLMSALSRRERLAAAQALDSSIATALRAFSLTQQRQETFKAVQAQALAMPELAAQMQAMMVHMEQMSQRLNQSLLGNQEQFHRHIQGVYTELAQSVEQSLHSSLSQQAQLTRAAVQPVVETAMKTIEKQAQHMHERMLEAGQIQLTSMSARLQASASSTLGEISRLSACSEELMRSRLVAEARWIEQHDQRMEHLSSELRRELSALRDDEALRGAAAVQRLGDLQSAVASHLTTLGTALEAPLTRLIETASEAPRAAAEVIAQLRLELSASSARDNAVLEERSRIMTTLNSLLASIHHASVEQRAVIDTLVTTSALALTTAGSEFAEKMDTETAKLSDIAAHVSSSAVEVSSLSEAFSFAVRSFGAANDKLIANLQRIEAAMDKSMARSDDQLAYYVAQAREVIDLSLSAQKDIFDELRQLPARPARLAHEVQ